MNEISDVLRVKGVNGKGYGIVPKLVMQDRRLTIQAKSIYAYFCSYAGKGDTAFPRLDTILYHLAISKDTFYRHFRLLKKYGYIEVMHTRQNGKFGRNVYVLVSNPVEVQKSDDFWDEAYQKEADYFKAQAQAQAQEEAQTKSENADNDTEDTSTNTDTNLNTEETNNNSKIEKTNNSNISTNNDFFKLPNTDFITMDESMATNKETDNLATKNNNIYNNNIYNNINQSIKKEFVDKEKLKTYKEMVDYNYLMDNFDNKLPLIDSILEYISKQSKLYKLDCNSIVDFLEYIKTKSFNTVSNLTAYLGKMFINFNKESEILLCTI